MCQFNDRRKIKYHQNQFILIVNEITLLLRNESIQFFVSQSIYINHYANLMFFDGFFLESPYYCLIKMSLF